MNVDKALLHSNLELLIRDIVNHIALGWEVDWNQPPTMLGYYYEVHMLRDDGIIDPVKASRAEILAKARAAKKAKAGGAAEEVDEE